mmetsp:Transcript_33372/g.51902  ORF Transcript_33372/g.51902 Transcript_33372/m.51902 type:complete len:210 (-) Transcript_33372:983-1612(-)
MNASEANQTLRSLHREAGEGREAASQHLDHLAVHYGLSAPEVPSSSDEAEGLSAFELSLGGWLELPEDSKLLGQGVLEDLDIFGTVRGEAQEAHPDEAVRTGPADRAQGLRDVYLKEIGDMNQISKLRSSLQSEVLREHLSYLASEDLIPQIVEAFDPSTPEPLDPLDTGPLSSSQFLSSSEGLEVFRFLHSVSCEGGRKTCVCLSTQA